MIDVMWNKTKHGLYKQFNFADFKTAWAFMERVAALAEQYQHHPRWENEWSVVQIWLVTHEGGSIITDKDHQLAEAIDALLAPLPPSELPIATPVPDEVKVFCDGGSRGNPGPSSYGFVILDMEDNILVDKGEYIGVTTNNVAEYNGCKAALEACTAMGVKEVHVYMDSMLVVNQMKGIFKVKNGDLWPIHEATMRLAQQFNRVSFEHVPREFNKLADAAVNRALDDQEGVKSTRVLLDESAASDNS